MNLEWRRNGVLRHWKGGDLPEGGFFVPAPALHNLRYRRERKCVEPLDGRLALSYLELHMNAATETLTAETITALLAKGIIPTLRGIPAESGDTPTAWVAVKMNGGKSFKTLRAAHAWLRGAR